MITKKTFLQYLLVVIPMLVIVGVLLYYFYSTSKDNVKLDTTQNVYQTLSEKFDLSQDLLFYEKPQYGILRYDYNLSKVVMIPPSSVIDLYVSGSIDAAGEIIAIEEYAMDFLTLPLTDYCQLDINIIINNDVLYSQICHYEG